MEALTQPSLPAGKASRLEFLFACACVCAALYPLADLFTFNAGIAFPDEFANLQWLQEWREGTPLPLSFAKGSLHRFGLAALCAAFGPSTWALHLLSPLAFLFECLLLYALAKRLFGARAACWALVASATAVFTVMRLRSLLSYSLLPLELLLVLWLPLKGRAAAFWAGLLAGAFLLEYDAWVACLPVLALAAFFEGRLRQDWKAALAGLALSAGIVAWLSWPDLGPYLEVRRSQNAAPSAGAWAPQLGEALKAWWLGGEPQAHLQPIHEPVFPLWAWLPLATGALGLAKGRRWILAWILLGFLPLISRNSEIEPQRAVAAWPALCLLAGEGMRRLIAAWKPLGVVSAIVACLFWLPATEKIFELERFKKIYGRANAFQAWGQDTTGMGEALLNLDYEPGGALHFLLEGAGWRPSRSGGCRAWVPREYAPAAPPKGVQVKKIGNWGSWYYLAGKDAWHHSALTPDYVIVYANESATITRLRHIDAELKAVFKSMPRFDARGRRRVAVRYLAEHPRADPWIRTALFEHALGQSFLIGEFPAPLVAQLEKEELLSPSSLLWSAQKLKDADPAWARRLSERARNLRVLK